MKKETIIKYIKALLKNKIRDLKGGYNSYKKDAFDAPSAMQSHSDTSKFQMNVLADNILLEINKNEKLVNQLDNIKIFLLSSDTAGKIAVCLAPEGIGGEIIKQDSYKIYTVSPNSKIGKDIENKKIGEEMIISNKTYKIIEIL